MSFLHPTPVANDSIASLRADLVGADYTVDAIAQVLGALANDALHREQPVPALRVLAGNDSPVALLVRLFILGKPLTHAELASALP